MTQLFWMLLKCSFDRTDTHSTETHINIYIYTIHICDIWKYIVKYSSIYTHTHAHARLLCIISTFFLWQQVGGSLQLSERSQTWIEYYIGLMEIFQYFLVKSICVRVYYIIRYTSVWIYTTANVMSVWSFSSMYIYICTKSGYTFHHQSIQHPVGWSVGWGVVTL